MENTMNEKSRMSGDRNVPVGALAPFLAVSFGLAWGILALYILLPVRMAGIFGQLTGRHPLFYLAVYAPAIAAFAIVAVRGGARGTKRFLSRLLLWRCSARWYVFLFVGVPIIFYAGAAMKGTIGEPFPFASISSLAAALFFAAIKGPIEEFGWRGVALPLLQRRLAPFWAGLVLGGIWGLWHLPAFLLSGTQQSQWSFAPFFVGCLAISIIATALFNASRGSILLSAFFHYMLMNPVFPDAAPYDTYLLVAVALVLSVHGRKSMFTPGDAVVAVIPANGPAGDR